MEKLKRLDLEAKKGSQYEDAIKKQEVVIGKLEHMLESSVSTSIKRQEYERNVEKLDREIRLLK